jgi:site-specific recombinase XerD
MNSALVRRSFNEGDPSIILKNFRSFLVSKNYSGSTIRNYLSDVDAYFDFIRNWKLEIRNSDLFSSDTVSAYIQTIQKNPAYSRYLSSLSKFFQYALDQGLTKTNPLKSALRDKKPNLDEILNNYQDFLVKKNFSESTIKNYLNDIRQFTDWSSKIESQ